MELAGVVAVVTGGASGLGLALARDLARRGARLVLSDIRSDALASAAANLKRSGAEVLAVRCDVTLPDDMEALANAAVEHFGRVNLFASNAGAFVAGLTWETPQAQYDWLIDLNLKSVMHGIRAFVPRMIAQGDACHVLTVASGAAISVYPGYGAYSATKHAALALTEALHLDLLAEGIDTIGVTIAMPGILKTAIMQPAKASPAELALEQEARFANRTVRAMERMMAGHIAGAAMEPQEAARIIIDAVQQGQLYVLPAHDRDRDIAVASAIGLGRAKGEDPWPPILDGIMQSLARTEVG